MASHLTVTTTTAGVSSSKALNASADATEGPVDVFAKGGLISADTSIKNRNFGNLKTFKKDGTDLAYGVGVQFRLLSLSVRAEYEKFDIDDVKDANMLSLGVTYTFL